MPFAQDCAVMSRFLVILSRGENNFRWKNSITEIDNHIIPRNAQF
jgi:hypothetical protein